VPRHPTHETRVQNALGDEEGNINICPALARGAGGEQVHLPARAALLVGSRNTRVVRGCVGQ